MIASKLFCSTPWSVHIRQPWRVAAPALFAACWVFAACKMASQPGVTIQNPADVARKAQPVFLELAGVAGSDDATENAISAYTDNMELASQLVDLDADGTSDHLLFLADLGPRQQMNIDIRPASTVEPPQRSQAELSHKFGGTWQDRKYLNGKFENVEAVRVPDQHTDHSFFFRYEGPGWESDKVGYRFYLDWRNAIDIFGKKTSEMVLQNVGQDGFDSYHEMADWGMDILKVGESLGIGSIGMWQDGKVYRVSKTDSITCAVLSNGPIYSGIQTRYFGWDVGQNKFDLASNLTIIAGSRMTTHDLTISGNARNLCTGLVKHENTTVLRSAVGGDWSYFATYGVQSLADDRLGMAILFRSADLERVADDGLSHVLVLKPQAGRLTYHFLAAWEKEPQGIQSQSEFIAYLDAVIAELNQPIILNLK